eukprot:TRINITY_DN14566_c0_g1_i1.p1 TRINITY_DN14566_c0_g1~~TRINITY_DN14566_c0_g1_i1.p1  ORF type:complete len:428 (+),score=59.55 TRINITY_DN14566_c0_g1_i1:36-1286(+)
MNGIISITIEIISQMIIFIFGVYPFLTLITVKTNHNFRFIDNIYSSVVKSFGFIDKFTISTVYIFILFFILLLSVYIILNERIYTKYLYAFTDFIIQFFITFCTVIFFKYNLWNNFQRHLIWPDFNFSISIVFIIFYTFMMYGNYFFVSSNKQDLLILPFFHALYQIDMLFSFLFNKLFVNEHFVLIICRFILLIVVYPVWLFIHYFALLFSILFHIPTIFGFNLLKRNEKMIFFEKKVSKTNLNSNNHISFIILFVVPLFLFIFYVLCWKHLFFLIIVLFLTFFLIFYDLRHINPIIRETYLIKTQPIASSSFNNHFQFIDLQNCSKLLKKEEMLQFLRKKQNNKALLFSVIPFGCCISIISKLLGNQFLEIPTNESLLGDNDYKNGKSRSNYFMFFLRLFFVFAIFCVYSIAII